MSRSKTTFLLVLLWLNVGCDAASTIRRSVDFDGSIDAGPPSDLPSLMEQLSMTPEESTKEIVALFTQVKEGAPADELLKVVSELKSRIPLWRTNRTADLNNAIDGVKQCATTMKEEMELTNKKKEECTTLNLSHEKARIEEAGKLATEEHSKAQQAEKKEVMQTDCGVFDQVTTHAKQTSVSYDNQENVGDYLRGVSKKICEDLLPEYDKAEKECDAATKVYNDVSAEEKNKTNEHEVQVALGDKIQHFMDVTCCKYGLATKDVCNSYDPCYEDKVVEYKSLEAMIKQDEQMKKVEWRVYSRIECLLPILGTSNSDAIDACRNKTYTSPDIVYPDIPKQDSCITWAAYPGTDAYKKDHFDSLPDNAKGKPVAECIGME